MVTSHPMSLLFFIQQGLFDVVVAVIVMVVTVIVIQVMLLISTQIPIPITRHVIPSIHYCSHQRNVCVIGDVLDSRPCDQNNMGIKNIPHLLSSLA
jgi:hypothetical protein